MRGLYLADCEETAWAEWMRATAEDGVPPAYRLPREMWALDVDIDGAVDLVDPGALAARGLPPIHPTQSQWPAYQAIGEWLWHAGARAIQSPSAAHVGHRVLCIFRTVPAVRGVTEVPPPSLHTAIPGIPVGLRT